MQSIKSLISPAHRAGTNVNGIQIILLLLQNGRRDVALQYISRYSKCIPKDRKGEGNFRSLVLYFQFAYIQYFEYHDICSIAYYMYTYTALHCIVAQI